MREFIYVPMHMIEVKELCTWLEIFGTLMEKTFMMATGETIDIICAA